MKRLSLALLAMLVLAGCGATRHAPAPQHQSALGSIHPPGWAIPHAGVTLSPPASLAGTAQMFDSITVATIPSNPFAAAGYTSGFWPTFLPIQRAFPHAHVISIAISVAHHADCLDVEPGDAVPSQAAAWVRADIAAGFKRPCVYSSFWEYVNQVRPALAAAGIRRSQVFEWDANYVMVPRLDAGFDATQWTDKALGRNLDESTVTLAFLSIAHPPLVVHAPVVLPVCLHKREASSACKAAKAKIASDLRAVASSKRALAPITADLAANKCVAPYRRAVCRTDGQRARVFTGRVRYFTHAAAGLQAAN